jgi:hypothetical protein
LGLSATLSFAVYLFIDRKVKEFYEPISIQITMVKRDSALSGTVRLLFYRPGGTIVIRIKQEAIAQRHIQPIAKPTQPTAK